MQCVRCSQPLPPRADRCLRCFALNPQNSQDPLAPPTQTPPPIISPPPNQAPKPLGISFESDPPPPGAAKHILGALSIHSDPPSPQEIARSFAKPHPARPGGDPKPLFDTAMSLDSLGPLEIPEPELPEFFSDPKPQPQRPPIPNPFTESAAAKAPAAPREPIDRDAETPPPPRQLEAAPLQDSRRAVAGSARANASVDSHSHSDPLSTPPIRARLAAWAIDGGLIALICALMIAIAALLLGVKRLAPLGAQSWESWADGLLFAHRLPLFWALLYAAIGLGYSWLFTALGGRTPGMRALSLQILAEDGSALDPVQSLWRALASLPSAALCLFGFILALVDPRGQTLHDRLAHSLVVSAGARGGSSAD